MALSRIIKQKLFNVDLGKTEAHHTNFKETVLLKSARSRALLGLNFRFFFTSLWPAGGSMRPNRAAMTPFGQQNPPVLLKLSVLCKKQAKTPIIILPQTPDFLEYETIKKI
jgi:hypothetical protein